MLLHGQRSPVVMCPGCDQPMKPVERKTILFTDGLVDVTYFCERCHTRTIRTTKPGDKSDLGTA
jgi:C4-type Zn-finger protein